MRYLLVKELIKQVEEYELFCAGDELSKYDFSKFKSWLNSDLTDKNIIWDGKENGRSLDSIINTLIVHMNRYAKLYSKAIIMDTPFVSQEDFIYLINLRACGPMTKMDLIKRNVHEKSPGMQIIGRLVTNGWIDQVDDLKDRRAKLICISENGLKLLDKHMNQIRKASHVVTGDLTEEEKYKLASLLLKLDAFHSDIYHKYDDSEEVLKFINK